MGARRRVATSYVASGTATSVVSARTAWVAPPSNLRSTGRIGSWNSEAAGRPNAWCRARRAMSLSGMTTRTTTSASRVQQTPSR
eukprot:2870550-Rhodomonas_salina.1